MQHAKSGNCRTGGNTRRIPCNTDLNVVFYKDLLKYQHKDKTQGGVNFTPSMRKEGRKSGNIHMEQNYPGY